MPSVICTTTHKKKKSKCLTVTEVGYIIGFCIIHTFKMLFLNQIVTNATQILTHSCSENTRANNFQTLEN